MVVVSSRRALRAARTRFPSPLRYPGGKGKIANYMKLVLLHNDIVGHEYVEVYAGGAAVALSLLFEEYVSAVHINDIDRGVCCFWRAVLESTDELCRRIWDEPVNVEQWRRQREIQESEQADDLDLAFSTFFLNRTNRSGIIRGGVIGGRKQRGGWRIDARYNKEELICRIEKVGRFRSRITVTRCDASEYLRERVCQLPSEVFLYLDPPYFVKGAGLYTNAYEDADHREIARLVRELSLWWVVSYDAAPEVLQLYDGLENITYDLSYSAADRYRGGEVMFFSSQLQPPRVDSPANILGTVVDRAKAGAVWQ